MFKRLKENLLEIVQQADLILLGLCCAASVFGIAMIYSATRYNAPTDNRKIIVQTAALLIGIVVYFAISMIDLEMLIKRWKWIAAFNVLFILLLRTPFGIEQDGNRAWLKFPFLPVSIGPAEVVKITFIILLAKVMAVRQNSISRPSTVLRLGFHLIFIFGLVVVASGDDGVAMMYILIFLVMLWTGGVSWIWFALGAGAAVIGLPIVWNLSIAGHTLVSDYQKQRILMVFDPSIDPQATGIRWHTNQSLLTLTGGGVTGQGLFSGTRTQAGALSQQHTDFIFSVIGEELGIVGCTFVLLLLAVIVARCIYVGVKSGSYMNRQVCIGIAAMLMFQMVLNVGMCLLSCRSSA